MKAEFSFCPVCGAALEPGFIDGKERKYCPNQHFVHYQNPLPVSLAIAVKNKRFLLIKRGIAPKKGMWGSPAGFIESGETPEEACLRELREETGVSGRIIKMAGVNRIEDREVYGDMLVVQYLVAAGDEEPVPGDEVDEARYFDIGELPDHYARRFAAVIEEVKDGTI